MHEVGYEGEPRSEVLIGPNRKQRRKWMFSTPTGEVHETPKTSDARRKMEKKSRRANR